MPHCGRWSYKLLMANFNIVGNSLQLACWEGLPLIERKTIYINHLHSYLHTEAVHVAVHKMFGHGSSALNTWPAHDRSISDQWRKSCWCKCRRRRQESPSLPAVDNLVIGCPQSWWMKLWATCRYPAIGQTYQALQVSDQKTYSIPNT